MRFSPQIGVLLASIPYTREKGVALVEVCIDVQYPYKAKGSISCQSLNMTNNFYVIFFVFL